MIEFSPVNLCASEYLFDQNCASWDYTETAQGKDSDEPTRVKISHAICQVAFSLPYQLCSSIYRNDGGHLNREGVSPYFAYIVYSNNEKGACPTYYQAFLTIYTLRWRGYT